MHQKMSLIRKTQTRAVIIAETVLAAVLFVCMALVYQGLVLNVEYQTGQVIDVHQVPGENAMSRLVVVDLGDRQRALRTSDWLIATETGQAVCVSKRHVLLRFYEIYRLELPGYCRNQIL